jgi:nucleoside-diphosphate-sugar epimerase
MHTHSSQTRETHESECGVRWSELFPSAFRGAKVCVTGGSGFIGSHLVDALVATGAHVVVIDDLTSSTLDNLSRSFERVTFVRESILNPERWSDTVRGSRCVFHLAAMGSVPRSIIEPQRCLDVNVRGTMNVLTAAHDAGVQRVIYSGSSSAYGVAPSATTKIESMAPLPRSPYAASKLAGEHLMRAWTASYGLDAVVLRYFNIFGPRQNGASVYSAAVAAFAEALGSGRSGTIFGDGRQTRDFTFVANAVFGNLLAAAANTKFGGEVFNIATGTAPSVLELHDTMAAAFGHHGLLPTFKPERRGDVASSCADISKARGTLGYRPLVSFEEGLAATVRWYKAHAHQHSHAA